MQTMITAAPKKLNPRWKLDWFKQESPAIADKPARCYCKRRAGLSKNSEAFIIISL